MKTLDDFLKAIRLAVAPTTYVRKAAQIRAYGRFLAGRNVHYYDAKKETIEEYLRQLPGGQGSKQQTWQVIKEFYGFLPVQPNPAGEIKFTRREDRLRLFQVPSAAIVADLITLSGKKEARLRRDGWQDALAKRNALMIELAYGSGLRRTELQRLNIEDIDLIERTAHIHGKGNKDRVVPVTAAAVNALRDYLFLAPAPRGPLLRSYRARRLCPEGVSDIFNKKIGVRPHLFRHACAVHMLKAGCSIRYIQKLLGHKSLDSTQIYTRIDKANLAQVVNRTHPRACLAVPD